MSRSADQAGSAEARVLGFSQRNVVSRKWHALVYEFEDVGVDAGLIDLCAPHPRQLSAWSRSYRRINRAAGGRHWLRHVGLEKMMIDRDYDLFFAFLFFPTEIPLLSSIHNLLDRTRRRICFIGEMYTHEVEQFRPQLELLKELGFERVFVLNPRPSQAVAALVGCPVEFLPYGVDALRFSPYPLVPPRTVDFYQFGRRSAVTHDAAREMARGDGLFYIYDTVFDVPLPDYRAHRDLVAELVKRSRYFFAYRPADDLERAREDDPLSSRYVEAISGGAVVLGSKPETPEYDWCFPWPDSTITIPFEARELRGVIEQLESEPERLARVRMTNIVETLRRHDWVYRWADILAAAGVEPTNGMKRRTEQLRDLAAVAEERQTRELERHGA